MYFFANANSYETNNTLTSYKDPNIESVSVNGLGQSGTFKRITHYYDLGAIDLQGVTKISFNAEDINGKEHQSSVLYSSPDGNTWTNISPKLNVNDSRLGLKDNTYCGVKVNGKLTGRYLKLEVCGDNGQHTDADAYPEVTNAYYCYSNPGAKMVAGETVYKGNIAVSHNNGFTNPETVYDKNTSTGSTFAGGEQKSLTLQLTDANGSNMSSISKIKVTFKHAPNMKIDIRIQDESGSYSSIVASEEDFGLAVFTSTYVFDVDGKIDASKPLIRVRFTPISGFTYPTELELLEVTFYEYSVDDGSCYYTYNDKFKLRYIKGYFKSSANPRGDTDSPNINWKNGVDYYQTHRPEWIIDESKDSKWGNYHRGAQGILYDGDKAYFVFGITDNGFDTKNLKKIKYTITGANQANVEKIDIYVNYIDNVTGLSFNSDDTPVLTNWTKLTSSSYAIGENYDGEMTVGTHFNAPNTGAKYVLVEFTITAQSGNVIYFNNISLHSSEIANYSEFTIAHKPAKYYTMIGNATETEKKSLQREKNTFNTKDEDGLIENENTATKIKIQNAHSLTDTIYMQRGEEVMLTIPDFLGEAFVDNSYQRWYNYETEGTFATGSSVRPDILVPTPELEFLKSFWSNTAEVGMTFIGRPVVSDKGYRFANGYVGSPVSAEGSYLNSMKFYFPTAGEAVEWFDEDKKEYVVACDVSYYNDFSKDYKEVKDSPYNAPVFWKSTDEDKKVYEPTLGSRFIWIIKLAPESFPKQVIKLTAPATRIKDYTYEMVALPLNARNYAKSGDANKVTATNPLTVTLVEGDTNHPTGIKLMYQNPEKEYAWEETDELKIYGDNRVIHYKYPTDDNNDGIESVNGDAPKCDIVVKNGSDEMVRFKITFVDNTQLLTQSQLEEIAQKHSEQDSYTGTYAEADWIKLYNRHPKYFADNLDYVTELNFDVETSLGVERGSNTYMQYPMEWGSSSYGFHHGPTQANRYEYGEFTRLDYKDIKWGYYGFLASNTKEAEYDKKTERLNRKNHQSTFHMHVDASDQPGIVARLPFKENLCSGSELFCTAWVRATRSSSADNAGLLFTVIKESSEGTQTILHRHLTSQIPSTQHAIVSAPGYNAQLVNGKVTGGSDGEWLQVYFSFINTAAVDADDSYILQVENNSASTSGADFYIDDIRVYIKPYEAKITQREFTCEDGQQLMKLELDWKSFESRMGLNTSTKTHGALDYCIIDKLIYDETLKNSTKSTELEKKIEAINASAVKIGKDQNQAAQIAQIYYLSVIGDHPPYNPSIAEGNLASTNTMEDEGLPGYYFYWEEDTKSVDPNHKLAVDFYSNMLQNRHYVMLIIPNTEENFAKSDVEDFAKVIDEVCCMSTDIFVESQNSVRLNGEVVDPNNTYCTGQTFHLSAVARVPLYIDSETLETTVKSEGNSPAYDANGVQLYKTFTETLNYDWFIGTRKEYDAENSEYGNVKHADALAEFRAKYPTKEDLDGVTADGNFSENHLKLIKHYYDAHKLILYRDHLDASIASDSLNMVLTPTQETITEGKDTYTICFEPFNLTLQASSGKSPEAKLGFGNINYTGAQYDRPSLRIGLDQIDMVRKNKNKSITINLRDVDYADGKTMALIDDRKGLYLIGTNDPGYRDDIISENFTSMSKPVGEVTDLSITTSGDCTLSAMFNNDFKAKEGYYYTMQAWFTDNNDENCYGTLSFDMKVVPEYIVWNGNETKNWNNDGNWVRANGEDFLYDKANHSNNDYVSNTTNTTSNAYVPMNFTKVIMKEDSQAQLYAAGFVMNTTDNKLEWKGEDENDNIPLESGLGASTKDIEYDLMAYEDGEDGANGLVTKKYRSNICEQIHLEPGAQLLHTEQLSYNKAWVEMLLTTNSWQLVGVPLQGVVAGDWYTWNTTNTESDKSWQNGRTEYFQDIKFDKSVNNRLNPAVYQRSWDGNGNVYDEVGSDAPTRLTFNTSTVSWGAAYNQADVSYVGGQGYSIKASNLTSSSSFNKEGKLLFRFPKADTNYSYPNTTLTRTNPGKFVTQQFYTGEKNIGNENLNRENNYIEAGDYHKDYELHEWDKISESNWKNMYNSYNPPALTTSDGTRYAIVSNPFPAPMSLAQFLAWNDWSTTQEYWITSPIGSSTLAGRYQASKDDANKYVIADSDGNEKDDVLIPPYGAFFVKLQDNQTTVAIAPQMQKFESSASGNAKEHVMLSISASNGTKTSSAAVGWSDGANDGFGDEDVELLRDPVIQGEDMPLVYTVAGDRAVSINSFANGGLIPLGVYSKDGQTVTLTFRGVDCLEDVSLYDAETNSDTPLNEGYMLHVEGGSHGRYFLRTRGTVNIQEEVVGEPMLTVFSPVQRQLNVSSTEPIYNVDVYTVGGALQQRVDLQQSTALDGSQTTTHNAQTAILRGIDSGVAIVHITTASGVNVRKVHVK